MNINLTVNELFTSDNKVEYEFYKTDYILVLTSAKVGTNTIKTFFQDGNIDYVNGGFSYNIKENAWECSTSQGVEVDIEGILQDDDLYKVIVFRNPKIKSISGMLEDFAGELSRISDIPYATSLIKQKYQLDVISEYIIVNPNIQIGDLLNHNPDLASLLFSDWFYAMLKDGDLLRGHSKLICSSLYWLLDSGRISITDDTNFVDLDDTSTNKLGTVLKKLYPDSTYNFTVDNNSRKNQWVLFDSILNGSGDFQYSTWYRIFEERINNDMLWYYRLKEKYQKTR